MDAAMFASEKGYWISPEPSEGPETATKRRVNGSLKFLSKLSTTVPKSTPKKHTNKSYKHTSHQELKQPRDVP
jgi:hypothetical protein